MFNKKLKLLSVFTLSEFALCSGLILCALTSMLTGCDSDNDSIKKVPELNDLQMSLTPLARGATKTEATFEQHIKNGLYLRSVHNNNSVDGVLESAAVTDQASAGNTGFSQTNVQQQGVAEGDRVKYDGEYMFIANNQYDFQILESSTQQEVQTSVRVMKRDNNGDVSELANISLNLPSANINSLYLNNNTLMTVSDIYQEQVANINGTSITADSIMPTQTKFNVSLINVSEPKNSTTIGSLTFDGFVVDSRRVGDTLYVISRYSPVVDGLVYAESKEEKWLNYRRIMDTNISDILPKYRDQNGIERALVTADNCYLPENATDKDGYNGMVTLTAININNPQQLSSACVNSQVQGIYATPSSVYLYSTSYVSQFPFDSQAEQGSKEISVIHKFTLDGRTIDYAASGTLLGRFDWHMANLRFSEHEGDLRVITTEGNRSSGYQHRLNILRQNNKALILVAQLPNASNPKPIGKVNNDGIVLEDIKSVRFFADLAYVVTFLTTDPLYVLDLSDSMNPVIRGELEVPGYSSYLHPVSPTLLLGIGQNVGLDILEINNGQALPVEDFPLIQGAKVSLFDISDLSAPKEIRSLVFEGAYTPVEYNYHAFTFLPTKDDSYHIAIPFERWLTTSYIQEEKGIVYEWSQENFLGLFDISNITQGDSSAEINYIGNVDAIDTEGPFNHASSWNDRAILHDDDVYYIHGVQVWKSLWYYPEQVMGPF
jgi:uncharacterized secreted protein with C-terminal beta-propeller domain